MTRSTLRLRILRSSDEGLNHPKRCNGRTKSACDATLSPMTIISNLGNTGNRQRNSRNCTITSI